MTFDEIVTEVKDRLNLTSSEATTRIGRAVNVMYRRVTSGLGLQVARRITGVIGTTSIGVQKLTFTGIEKIERILDTRSGSTKEIDETTFEEIRVINPSSSDTPHMWAVEKMGPSSVTIRLDVLPQTAFQLLADGLETAATLSGSQVPNFNQDFHDVLVEGVIADELRKQEKPVLARIAQDTYDKRLSELRFFIVKSANANLKAGGAQKKTTLSGNGGGGGGSAPSGGASYTQTGMVTFDRDPNAPFAVTANSDFVDNLIADDVHLENTDRLIGRDTAGAGTSEEITVGGGLEFTGSGGIQVANDGVTYARMQNVSAASRLLGRGDSGSGDPQELTLGLGLVISGTALDVQTVYSTVTSTGTQNNFALAVGRRTLLYCNNASALTITGFAVATPVAGDEIYVFSIGAGQVNFSHQAAGSTAANRLINIATGAVTSLAAGVGTARFVYDATTQRWRMVAHEQGAWISPAYAAGDFTGAGSMTWTVDSGDVRLYRYWLKGRTLIVAWAIDTSSVGGTPSSILRLAIPGGFTSATTDSTTGHMYRDNGGAYGFAAAYVAGVGVAFISLYVAGFGTATWTAATNNTGTYGEIAIEVP